MVGAMDNHILPGLHITAPTQRHTRGYIPRTFRFSDDLEPLASGSSLDGKGSATAIGSDADGA